MTVAPDTLLSILKLQPPGNSPDARLDGGAAERVGEALSAAATAAIGMGIVGPAALPSVMIASKNVVGAVADALGTRLRDVFVSAWNKREEIRKYRDTSKYPPNEKRYIQLYQHPISWTYTPVVKVSVPGGGSFDLPLEVKLSIKVDQAVLVLVGGKATAIEPGKGKVEATAKIGGLELCPPATLELGTLPGSLAI